MIAALATLVFLAAVWLVVVVSAKLLDESGARILAALNGGTGRPPATLARVWIRVRSQPVRRAAPRLRAAA